MRKFLGAALGAGALALATAGQSAQAQATYNVSVSLDYSGPFAAVMDSWYGGQQSVFDWWNETRGKQLGVKLNLKTYDMRYDASVVASTWPSILATDKPIMHLGFGTPDLITLMKRLPGDKVPMLMSTAMVGLVWKPNGWHFSFRPTYSHEFVGLLNYLQQKKGGKLTIGAISTQTAARICRSGQRRTEIRRDQSRPLHRLDSQWVDTSRSPSSTDPRPDAAASPTSSWSAAHRASGRYGKALSELGAKIPMIMSTHNGLTEVAKAVPLSGPRGVVFGVRFRADMDSSVKAAEIFEEVQQDQGHLGPRRSADGGAVAAGAVGDRARHRDSRRGQADPARPCTTRWRAGLRTRAFPGPAEVGAVHQGGAVPDHQPGGEGGHGEGRQSRPVSTDWMAVPELAKW